MLAFQRGELKRVVIDRDVKGIVTESHYTQIPSDEDALFLLVWGMIHVGLAILWARTFLRR